MTKFKINSKQPQLGVSIFAVMTQMAAAYNALNLSQGFPDFDCNPSLVNLVHKYMKKGYNQYAPMPGIIELRESLSAKIESLYGRYYNPDTEITVTAGATEALYAAITSVVHHGDEVIIFEPSYDIYLPVIRYSGGIPVFIKLKHPDYHIEWDEVRQAITDKTRLIILNSPHNPTGAVLSETDLHELKKTVIETNILLINDEVYEHIIFDDKKHLSLAGDPDLAARSFVISSFGKTYHTTGWKVGYCAAPSDLSAEFCKIHQFITFSVNTPIQYAYAEFLKEKNHYLHISDFYQQKRDLFADMLEPSRFKLLNCSGTYFQLAAYDNISDQTEMEFAARLTKEYKVAAIPTSPFYHQGDNHHVIRFCFAKKDETLEKAAELLCKI